MKFVAISISSSFSILPSKEVSQNSASEMARASFGFLLIPTKKRPF